MNRLLLIFALLLTGLRNVYAQCAMCKASVESNTNANSAEVADGFNKGIMLLMILPYVLFAGIVGLIWYNYRKKKRASLIK